MTVLQEYGAAAAHCLLSRCPKVRLQSILRHLNLLEEPAHCGLRHRPDEQLHGLAITERYDRWERADLSHTPR
jgi:hypothetical protein